MVYEEESGDIVLCFTGDALVTRRVSMYREPKFLELVEHLRAADVSFTNAETLFHRFESPGIADTQGYGTYAQCDPEVIGDLKWMGIDMVSTANNHSIDYGEGGIVANLKYLDEYEMPHAGTGVDLVSAVAPAYLDTAKGSVALLAVTITMPNYDHRPGNARGPVPARPGTNVLRKSTTSIIPKENFAALAATARGLQMGPPLAEGATEMTFSGQRYRSGDAFGREVVTNQHDLELNLRWIREARRMAEWVVVSLHCHEGGASQDEPAQIAIDFAHAAIDAGADAVFGHGPHRDRGIEIYKGKPIMYSIATLFLHNEIIENQPDDIFVKYGLGPEATISDMYDIRTHNDTRASAIQFNTVAIETRFAGHELAEIVVRPLDVGFSTGTRRMRGRPMIATGPLASEILDKMQRLSEPFGTKLEIEGEIGRIKVA